MPHHIITDYRTEKGVPICLHENRFFRMMFNGYYHYLDAVRYGRGVAMVPQFDNGDFLMIKLRRAPAIGFSIEFPRGGVESEETLESAARRELLEETGYDAGLSAKFIGNVGADTATLNGVMPVYYVRIPESSVQGGFDTAEIEELFRVTPAMFKEWVCAGKIIDGLTLSSYALASLQGLTAS